MNSRSYFSFLACAAMFGLSVPAASAADSSVIRMSLERTGNDPDASGQYVSTLGLRSSMLSVRAAGLAAGQIYHLEIGGVERAAARASERGRCAFSLTTRPRKGVDALDFDPRGEPVVITDGLVPVLQGVASGLGEARDSQVDERTRLTRLSGSGEADVRYRILRDGRRSFSVKLERVTGTNWQLYVGGIWRGDIPVTGRQTTVVYETAPLPPGRRLLDFDPRGEVVDIAQETNLVFSSRLQARATGINFATPSLTQSFLPSTGADPDGTARARFRVEADARRKLSIELESVPAGNYELLVNNSSQGFISVASTAGGTKGELEFSSREDNGDELPLTFDPAGSTFVIRLGDVVYFEGALAGSLVTGGDDGNGSGSGAGLAPDGLAGLTFDLDDQPGGDQMEFTTDTSGVDLGTSPDPFAYEYTRLTATQARVEVRDGNKLDAYVFTFTALNAGTWVRDEYRDGSLRDRDTGRFRVIRGTNSGGTGTNDANGNGLVSPLRFELPLFNLGAAASGSAAARFSRDDRGRRHFEVQVEDVPVGSYSVLVGGAVVASLVVTEVPGGTRGEVEFEDDDDPGHLALTFDPLGQAVAVSQGETLYFQRVLPAGN